MKQSESPKYGTCYRTQAVFQQVSAVKKKGEVIDLDEKNRKRHNNQMQWIGLVWILVWLNQL